MQFIDTTGSERPESGGGVRKSCLNGGIMHRFLTLRAASRVVLRVAMVALLVAAGLVLVQSPSHAQYYKQVSGYLPATVLNDTFYSRQPLNSARDTIYEIAGDFRVSGHLIILNGAEVHFLPNS